MYSSETTIAALTTPPGRGGVGIIRVSGELALTIAHDMLHFSPKPRYAHYTAFFDQHKNIIDQGIALYFKSPHSFTGEDIVEFHAHGGPIVLDILLRRIIELGAKPAEPGEFSYRAFLNNKIDLAQAEAIADLISASTEVATRSAQSSLQGDFSRQINQFTDEIIALRTYVEAMLDFPDEEVDFLSSGKIKEKISDLLQRLDTIYKASQQGSLLREGMKVVIAGKPNAGKSSLLNQLAGRDLAIVTPIAGTTRDVLQEYIHLDGMPLHLVDTAGLREKADVVEQEGIRRALIQIKEADSVLLLVDSTENSSTNPADLWPHTKDCPPDDKIIIIHNKVDLIGKEPQLDYNGIIPVIKLSAKKGTGIDLLKNLLKKKMGYISGDGVLMARRRHLTAIATAVTHVKTAHDLLDKNEGSEFVAEELRLAQESLSSITGKFTSDDLLGEIFSSFCIGK